MRAAFFEIQDWERLYLAPSFAGAEVEYSSEPLDDAHLPAARDFDCISVFVYSCLTEKVLNVFPQLPMVATRSTGYDHVDTKTCAHRAIAVANVPTYGENTAFNSREAQQRILDTTLENLRAWQNGQSLNRVV